jgi:hypothetical protein
VAKASWRSYTRLLDVNFRRATLVAPEPGERLTIDADVGMRTPDGDGFGRLEPQLAVVESKTPRGTALATRELNQLGARRLESMSKYAWAWCWRRAAGQGTSSSRCGATAPAGRRSPGGCGVARYGPMPHRACGV